MKMSQLSNNAAPMCEEKQNQSGPDATQDGASSRAKENFATAVAAVRNGLFRVYEGTPETRSSFRGALDELAGVLGLRTKTISKRTRNDNNTTNFLVNGCKGYTFGNFKLCCGITISEFPLFRNEPCKLCKYYPLTGQREFGPVRQEIINLERYEKLRKINKLIDEGGSVDQLDELGDLMRIREFCKQHKTMKNFGLTKHLKTKVESNQTQRSQMGMAIVENRKNGKIAFYSKVADEIFGNPSMEPADMITLIEAICMIHAPFNLCKDLILEYIYRAKLDLGINSKLYVTQNALRNIRYYLSLGEKILGDIVDQLVDHPETNFVIQADPRDKYNLRFVEYNESSEDYLDAKTYKMNINDNKPSVPDITSDEQFPVLALPVQEHPDVKIAQMKRAQVVDPGTKEVVLRPDFVTIISGSLYGYYNLKVRQSKNSGESKEFRVGKKGKWENTKMVAGVKEIIEYTGRVDLLEKPKQRAHFLKSLIINNSENSIRSANQENSVNNIPTSNRFASLLNVVGGGNKKGVTNNKTTLWDCTRQVEMVEIVQNNEWRIIQVPGDGDCFFHVLKLFGMKNDRYYYKALFEEHKIVIDPVEYEKGKYVTMTDWIEALNTCFNKVGLHFSCFMHNPISKSYHMFGSNYTKFKTCVFYYNSVNCNHFDFMYHTKRVRPIANGNRETVFDMKDFGSNIRDISDFMNRSTESKYLVTLQNEMMEKIGDITKFNIRSVNNQLTADLTDDHDTNVAFIKAWNEVRGGDCEYLKLNMKQLLMQSDLLKKMAKTDINVDLNGQMKDEERVEPEASNKVKMPKRVIENIDLESEDIEIEEIIVSSDQETAAALLKLKQNQMALDLEAGDSGVFQVVENYYKRNDEMLDILRDIHNNRIVPGLTMNGLTKLIRGIKPEFIFHSDKENLETYKNKIFLDYLVSSGGNNPSNINDFIPGGPKLIIDSNGLAQIEPKYTGWYKWQKVHLSSTSVYLSQLTDIFSDQLKNYRIPHDLFTSFVSLFESTCYDEFKVEFPGEDELAVEIIELMEKIKTNKDTRSLRAQLVKMKTNAVKGKMVIRYHSIYDVDHYNKSVVAYLRYLNIKKIQKSCKANIIVSQFSEDINSDQWVIHKSIMETLYSILGDSRIGETILGTIMTFIHRFIYPVVVKQEIVKACSFVNIAETILNPALRNAFKHTKNWNDITLKVNNFQMSNFLSVDTDVFQDLKDDAAASNLYCSVVYLKFLELANVRLQDAVGAVWNGNVRSFKGGGGTRRRRLGFGVKMGDLEAMHLKLQTNGEAELMRQLMENKDVRTPVFVELPGSIGVHFPHLNNDSDTLMIGVDNRVGKLRDEFSSHALMLFRKIDDYKFDNQIIECMESHELMDLETYLKHTTYTETEKNEIRKAMDAYYETMKFKSTCNLFVKHESYELIKVARAIFSATNIAKALIAPLVRSIEKVYFRQISNHVKGLNTNERLEKLMNLDFVETLHKVAVSDYEKFESNMTAGIILNENHFMLRILGQNVEAIELLKHHLGIFNGVKCRPCDLTYQMILHWKRMSGWPNTALGNFHQNDVWSDAADFVYYCFEKYGYYEAWKFEPGVGTDFYDWVQDRLRDKQTTTINEGDDNISIVTAEKAKHMEACFKQLGISIKLEVYDKVEEACFCGLIASKDGNLMRDAIKTIIKMGSTNTRYMWSKEEKLQALMVMKAKCMLHEYKNCPILSAYCIRIIRDYDDRSKKFENEVIKMLKTEMSSWEWERFNSNMEGLADSIKKMQGHLWSNYYPVTEQTRLDYFKIFKIDPESQMRIEHEILNGSAESAKYYLYPFLPKEAILYSARYVMEEPLMQGVVAEVFPDESLRYVLGKESHYVDYYKFICCNKGLLEEPHEWLLG